MIYQTWDWSCDDGDKNEDCESGCGKSIDCGLASFVRFCRILVEVGIFRPNGVRVKFSQIDQFVTQLSNHLMIPEGGPKLQVGVMIP